MNIKLVKPIRLSGAPDVTIHQGAILSVTPETAKAYLSGGFAVPEATEIEKAIPPSAETAELKPQRAVTKKESAAKAK